uniref:Uncharacterized protein n=1 Tax=Capra hircus TaxID=9925 RepID=A0A8C2NAN3_CAPHI
MSEFWHKLGCCVVEKPQPVSLPSPTPPHTEISCHRLHIEVGTVGSGKGLSISTGAVQEQMRSKGNRDRPWSNSRAL